ncbi:LysM peptidoglycan-binding domain-containing protein [Devosia sp. CN2-171]|uniref:LysM peptidoglycan-binding domain-containing protein n=1 Tax=Devosia sp. CN2-171 TaxID=3400909 RepID=UPI003BF8ED70
MIGLGIIGAPLVQACAGDSRGVVTCLREMADRRFDLPGEADSPARVVDTQAVPAAAVPDVALAEVTTEEQAAAADVVPKWSAPSDEAKPAEPAMPVANPPPGQGGPLLPAAPTAINSPPSRPAEPAPPVLREAAIDETAATPETAPSVPVVPAPTGLPATEAFSITPLENPPAEAREASLPDAAPPVAPPPVFEAPVSPAPEPPAAQSPPAPEPVVEAAGDEPLPPPPAPAVTAPLVLAPTIDAIELEGASSYISGSGPAGAVVRLYSDGKFLGESPVEEGRWLVEAGDILATPSSELRAEAIEPDSGKRLGESVITIEIELPQKQPAGPPPDAAPAELAPSEVAPPPVSAPPSDPEPAQRGGSDSVAPAPDAGSPSDLPETGSDTPSTDALDPAELPPVQEEPSPESLSPSSPAPVDAERPAPLVANPETDLPPPAPAAQGIVEPPAVPDALASEADLPPLAAIIPDKDSASVEILPPSPSELDALPPIGATDHESATIELDPPSGPALMAEFSLPKPRPSAPSVTVLRLFPFGDPVYGRFSGGQAIIRRGDTLWSLAHRYYGAGIHYRTIFEANRDQISRPSKIYPGQVFDLPLVTKE